MYTNNRKRDRLSEISPDSDTISNRDYSGELIIYPDSDDDKYYEERQDDLVYSQQRLDAAIKSKTDLSMRLEMQIQEQRAKYDRLLQEDKLRHNRLLKALKNGIVTINECKSMIRNQEDLSKEQIFALNRKLILHDDFHRNGNNFLNMSLQGISRSGRHSFSVESMREKQLNDIRRSRSRSVLDYSGEHELNKSALNKQNSPKSRAFRHRIKN